jgi:hypothetical protein
MSVRAAANSTRKRGTKTNERRYNCNDNPLPVAIYIRNEAEEGHHEHPIKTQAIPRYKSVLFLYFKYFDAI